MIDATFVSDKSFKFQRENLLDRFKQLIMTIDHKIRDEKLQADVNREAGKVSAVSPTDKYFDKWWNW